MDKDKVKGKTDEMAGKARQAYGDMADDPEQQSEGETQEMKGKARSTMSDIKDKAEDIKDKFN
ncbi:MAG: CsbD family protein [Dehalococcoidia bacterium]|nr:CsbD family protein [Dehalococcoidia bacterium]